MRCPHLDTNNKLLPSLVTPTPLELAPMHLRPQFTQTVHLLGTLAAPMLGTLAAPLLSTLAVPIPGILPTPSQEPLRLALL